MFRAKDMNAAIVQTIGERNRFSSDKQQLPACPLWQLTGRLPTETSGPIPEAPGETWKAVQVALVRGGRGLPGGNSLAYPLGRKRTGPA